MTNDTGEVVGLAVRLSERLFREGFRYAKCGVMIMCLLPETIRQPTLWKRARPPAERSGGEDDGPAQRHAWTRNRSHSCADPLIAPALFVNGPKRVELLCNWLGP